MTELERRLNNKVLELRGQIAAKEAELIELRKSHDILTEIWDGEPIIDDEAPRRANGGARKDFDVAIKPRGRRRKITFIDIFNDCMIKNSNKENPLTYEQMCPLIREHPSGEYSDYSDEEIRGRLRTAAHNNPRLASTGRGSYYAVDGSKNIKK